MATFNSKEYDWSKLDVILLGRPVATIQGVKYKETQEKEAIYGRGNKPLKLGSGNKSYEGEITLLQSDIEALKIASGNGKSIVDIEAFDLVIAYVGSDGVIVTDTLKGCEFTEVEKGMSQGDKKMEVSLPILALDLV